MELSGLNILASQKSLSADRKFQAINPISNELLEPKFSEGTSDEVDYAANQAANDFDAFRKISPLKRGEFLESIAAELLSVKTALLDRCHLETGLSMQRLEGELNRTTNQLKLFAQILKGSSFHNVQVERALPERKPVAKPDIRLTHIPVGPVVVFGASNFPLAFSVAGGDTASAFAAGCPVIVKGHPSHPGTSEIAGYAIQKAVEKCDLPKGIFSLIQGSGNKVGEALVKHPKIKSVAFTGSQTGGRALFNIAASRPEPIPVFAEMGSVNPIFVLPDALASRGADIAQRYVESITLGVGQFCTNPGLLFAIKGSDLNMFMTSIANKLKQVEPAPMLNSKIKKNFLNKIGHLSSSPEVIFSGGTYLQEEQGCLVLPSLFKTDAATFLVQENLSDEVFGPSAIIVECGSTHEMMAIASQLEGQLTATVHADLNEEKVCKELFFVLEKKAGRLLLNDFPTGVEVCSAMNHGGPYPATTDSRWTSVGSAAMNRFLRPICYQNFTQSLLPEELKDRPTENWNLVDTIMARIGI